ncbi:hypothetical protein DF159_27190 [Burkholderia ubonensis]|uniref:Uncharacterized protein n=1 Tax=Burkholderia ubonensis TaxID=101571 RepID=A0AB74CXQ7_9BURK|nr:hypothetical protein CJO70_04200 [Burkholderia ubonensis]PAJ95638.1 hypothetical protein CJO69_04680 [Burkholderia ubonensis]PAK01991.1 hypothetical protein CJO68_06765 [Burkholderia ubonensis]RQP54105.1 hypothetical protein DF159_27190 [Burkholderia ubonensis]RQP69301.1 hypothetical protein DF015_32170 [Burkholderia ubonensis]
MCVTDIDSCELSYEAVDEVVRMRRQGWQVVQEEAEYLIKSAGLRVDVDASHSHFPDADSRAAAPA